MTITKRRLGSLISTSALASGLIFAACGDDKSSDPMETPMNDGGANGGNGSGMSTGSSTGSTTGSSTGSTTGSSTGSTTGNSDGGMPMVTCKPLAERPVEMIQAGDITTDTTWACEKTYKLLGRVNVKGATLKVTQGTVVQGTTAASLFILSSAKIDAQGTKDEPVVFTSDQPVGKRKSGDWQGMVLLGKADINRSTEEFVFEGLPDAPENRYGGTDDKHNCGTLKYVRIEFAGKEIATDKELNGLSVAGCGSDTVLDYVQSHLAADDAFEFFGGTANLKHAIASSYDDDGLDWDEGYRGKVQFMVIQQPLNSAEADPNGIEADNQAAVNTATPYSNPTVYNATLIGGNETKSFGMVLRRGTKGIVENFVLQGFKAGAVDIRDAQTAMNANDKSLVVSNGVFFGSGADGMTYFNDATDNDSGFVEDTFFKDAALKNAFVDPKLGDGASRTAPNFVPAADSPAKDDAATPPDDGFFDKTATFKGAMQPGGADWTAGWAAYPAN